MYNAFYCKKTKTAICAAGPIPALCMYSSHSYLLMPIVTYESTGYYLF